MFISSLTFMAAINVSMTQLPLLIITCYILAEMARLRDLPTVNTLNY